MKFFHKIIGCFFGLIFILIFTGKLDWFNEFQHAQDIAMSSDSGIPFRSRFGFVYIYTLSFLSVFFIVCPAITTRIWCSNFESVRELNLKERVWIFFGYFLLFITFGILFCFE